MMITKKYLDELTYNVIGAAIEVHKEMGRGLLESVYHRCLVEELKFRNLRFQSEMRIPVIYKGVPLDIDFRCDLIIEESLIVEIKSITELNNIHEAQLLNYMKLLKAPKGILMNFNCGNIFREGQKTFVNELFSALPST